MSPFLSPRPLAPPNLLLDDWLGYCADPAAEGGPPGVCRGGLAPAVDYLFVQPRRHLDSSPTLPDRPDSRPAAPPLTLYSATGGPFLT